MSIVSPEGDNPIQSLLAQPKYEISITVYNEKSERWEPASSHVGEKATQFVEQSGIFNLIAESQSGDILEITANGIYKKKEAAWSKELTKNEVNEKFPKVEGAIKSLNLWQSLLNSEEKSQQALSSSFVSEVIEKETIRETSIIIEVRIIDKTLSDVKDLTEGLKATHSKLADSITHHSMLHQTLQKEHSLLMQQEKIDPQYHAELLKRIKENEQFLVHLIQVGHTALYGEKMVESLEAPAFKMIAKGKAKEVFVRKGAPQYVYYTPIYSLFKTKENEIIQEIKIAKQITSNLFTSDLIDLFTSLQLSEPKKIAQNLLT